MTTDRELETLVHSWLEEGGSSLSDRVFAGVMDRLSSTPRRHAVRDGRHFPMMSGSTRIVLAAAAVLVAVVGVSLLVGKPGRIDSGPPATGPGPAATQPASAASSSPEPATASAWPTFSGVPGYLAPGTYSVSAFPGLGVRLTVPVGWLNRADHAVLKLGSRPARDAQVGFLQLANLYADPCRWQTGALTPPAGPTVDDLARALARLPGGGLTAPADISVDGFVGKRVELTVPADLSTCQDRVYRTWLEPDGSDEVQTPGQHDLLWILDVRGTRLVVDAKYFDETPAVDRAELRQILDSIRIAP